MPEWQFRFSRKPMNPRLLSQLLEGSEIPTVDFKLEHYQFSESNGDEKRKRGEFAKDVVSMANTPRDESAFIVIGAKRRLDGTMERKGVQYHVDDNLLQQKLDKLSDPTPRFHYHQVELNQQKFGVIEIPAYQEIGPFMPRELGSGCKKQMKLLRFAWHVRHKKNSGGSVPEAFITRARGASRAAIFGSTRATGTF